MAKENNNKSFVLRIDAATMDALELWAADEFRSINGQLQWIIADALRRSGRLKKPRAAAGVIFLLRRFGESLPTAEALWKGAVCALVIAFCWALGVWAAVGPEPSDDDGGQDGEAVGDVGARAAWRGRVLCFVLLLGAFALVCSSQISEMLGGECSLARGFGGILLKAMAVAAVVVPVWLDSGRSKWQDQ